MIANNICTYIAKENPSNKPDVKSSPYLERISFEVLVISGLIVKK